MSLHPEKCQALHIKINRKRKPLYHQCRLHGHLLKSTKETKYLGATLSDNISLDSHITNWQYHQQGQQDSWVLEDEPKGMWAPCPSKSKPTKPWLCQCWSLQAHSGTWMQFRGRLPVGWLTAINRPLQSVAASKVTQSTTISTTSKADHLLQTPPWRRGHHATPYLPPAPQQDQCNKHTVPPTSTTFRHAVLPTQKLLFP